MTNEKIWQLAPTWHLWKIALSSEHSSIFWVKMNFIINGQTKMYADTFNISHIITLYSL